MDLNVTHLKTTWEGGGDSMLRGVWNVERDIILSLNPEACVSKNVIGWGNTLENEGNS